ncbi:MAGE family-domain-containing protein [Lophiotrema nucula]|uniref:MAGE family-domain-containing protein n=1 Tax=Lophiotrema nucula TaxID=690887 RepID=A0A6A5YK79_9PLEO|nr:MAGE family-domain-containing protein [Lophiotrema nucula]
MPPRGRKRRAPAEEDEDEIATSTQTQRGRHEDTPMEDDDDKEESQETGSGSIAQLSKSLVRYALACEYARIPIKRQDVSQKVLGSHSRSFKQVFDAANSHLLDTFGMEMVELPNREKVTTRQKRAAAASESQNKTTSNQWILRNALPDQFRVSGIISPSSAPTSEVESAYVGLYTMIISLIMLAGGQMSEQKLDRYFKRMNIDQSMPVDSTDKALARMIKEGYIVKIKESSGGDEQVDWMVGPRGKVEVGDSGVMELVRTVYGQDAGQELEQKLARSLRIADGGASAQQQAAVNGAAAPSTQGAGRRRGRPRRGQHEDEDEDD